MHDVRLESIELLFERGLCFRGVECAQGSLYTSAQAAWEVSAIATECINFDIVLARTSIVASVDASDPPPLRGRLKTCKTFMKIFAVDALDTAW